MMSGADATVLDRAAVEAALFDVGEGVRVGQQPLVIQPGRYPKHTHFLGVALVARRRCPACR